MSVIILLLIASLSVSLLFLGAFLWSIRDKQFDDDYSPAMRILFDDHPQSTDDQHNAVEIIKPIHTLPNPTLKNKS
jgi:cbb3-type cytochrome oxidase maturation protein